MRPDNQRPAGDQTFEEAIEESSLRRVVEVSKDEVAAEDEVEGAVGLRNAHVLPTPGDAGPETRVEGVESFAVGSGSRREGIPPMRRNLAQGARWVDRAFSALEEMGIGFARDDLEGPAGGG